MRSVLIVNEHLLKYTVLNSSLTLTLTTFLSLNISFYYCFTNYFLSFSDYNTVTFFHQTETITENHKQSKYRTVEPSPTGCIYNPTPKPQVLGLLQMWK